MDSKEAYDKTDREAVWKVLRVYGVTEYRNIKSRGKLLEENKAHVRVGGDEGAGHSL